MIGAAMEDYEIDEAGQLDEPLCPECGTELEPEA